MLNFASFPMQKFSRKVINTRNVMKLHLHVVESSFVAFLLVNVIEGCRKLLQIHHFILKTKSLASTVAKSKWHSGHCYKASVQFYRVFQCYIAFLKRGKCITFSGKSSNELDHRLSILMCLENIDDNRSVYTPKLKTFSRSRINGKCLFE